VVIRANRFVDAGERAIQFGGGVGVGAFRPQPPGNVAASNIVAEGNVITYEGSPSGIRAGIAFVNVNGTTFRNNFVHRPRTFVGRILKENNSPGFVDTQNGVFKDNIIYWNNGDFLPAFTFNSSINTLPATFHFDGNMWYNATNPANSNVTLPAAETNGTYGVNPNIGISSVVPWDFDWGMWLVNATDAPQSFNLGASAMLLRADPTAGAKLDLGQTNPLIGNWTFSPLSSPVVDLEAFSHVVLVTPISGDFNLDGSVDAADYVIWRKTGGSTDDYNTWRANFGRKLDGGSTSSAMVPEPATAFLLIFAAAAGRWRVTLARHAPTTDLLK
jgi:hypothetical protein